jgi:hypothetical protein
VRLAAKGAQRVRPFAPWRIVVWLVMLLAAAGFVLNLFAAVVAGHAIGALSDEAIARGPDPRVVLAWALAYTFAAFAVMVISLSALRWRDWARNAMRLAALLLMVWAAYTAWITYGQWQQAGIDLAQAGLSPAGAVLEARKKTILLVALLLKVASVPILGWLAWALGSVRVRQQFALPAL